VRTYVRTSVTVASSVANDVTKKNDIIMRTGAASAVGARRHNENDVTMIIAVLWRYGDWRHVATGCTALVIYMYEDTSIQVHKLIYSLIHLKLEN